MRRFTILHLEIRKLTSDDILWLAFYSLLVISCVVVKPNYSQAQFWLRIIIIWLNFYAVCASLFGLRLRSIIFSLIWLTLNIALIIKSLMIFAPITFFGLYHTIRLIFWGKFEREFIPLAVGRFGDMHWKWSKFEKVGADGNDKTFMNILYWLGVVILLGNMIYIFFSFNLLI